MEKSEVVNEQMDNLLSGTEAEFIGCHRDIVTNGTNAASYLVRMCRALKTMNDRNLYVVAGFTSFGEYTEKAVGLKVRQAYNYISLLDKFSPEFLESNFNLGVSKLLVLSRIGESEAKEVIENNEAGEMSVAELKRLIGEKDEKIRQLEIEAIKDTDDEIKAREKKYEQEESRLQTELDTAIREREEARTKYDKALSDNARIKEENKKLKDGLKTVERVEVDKPETLAALEETKKAIEAKDSLIGYVPKRFTKRSSKRKKDELNEIFQTAFAESEEKGLKRGEQIACINDRMRELYKERFLFADLIEIASFDKDFTKYIQERFKKMLVAKLMRVSRFKEKARLHCWNYFITQTYDSAKYASEEEFKDAYLTCLSHLCTDHGWRVMGVFERGKKSNRLHFHGVAYIPAGRMKGYMKPTKYYNEISHKVEKSTINSFFAVRFGRNDFQDITKQNGIEGISNYIVKYILKSDEKVYYSRGIDGSITLELSDEDIVCGYKVPYGEKFLVFDCVMYGTILDCRRKYEVS